MINANAFLGATDSETLENALASLDSDRTLIIEKRASTVSPERDFWLIDRAILIPENTTVILKNCKIKLSDSCRDNFFRSANCGTGIANPKRIKNVKIIGEGEGVLEGADHPRATGDGSKILADPCPYKTDDLCRLATWIPEERRTPEKLNFMDRHTHTFGTDVNKPDEHHKGDWRNIGILLANVENFTISNIKIRYSHCWAISLEDCAFGKVKKIVFDAAMYREIDGLLSNIENQDGLDLRNGCHDIEIDGISGTTGDDVIALTAIKGNKYHDGGELGYTHVLHSDWTKREAGIYNVTIRNVTAHSTHCYDIRLLSCDTKIKNVTIDGLYDTTPEGMSHGGGILIGEGDDGYGINLKDGVENVDISNVTCDRARPIVILGYLKDSKIQNVNCQNPNIYALNVKREGGLINVTLDDINASKILKQS